MKILKTFLRFLLCGSHQSIGRIMNKLFAFYWILEEEEAETSTQDPEESHEKTEEGRKENH